MKVKSSSYFLIAVCLLGSPLSAFPTEIDLAQWVKSHPLEMSEPSLDFKWESTPNASVKKLAYLYKINRSNSLTEGQFAALGKKAGQIELKNSEPLMLNLTNGGIYLGDQQVGGWTTDPRQHYDFWKALQSLGAENAKKARQKAQFKAAKNAYFLFPVDYDESKGTFAILTPEYLTQEEVTPAGANEAMRKQVRAADSNWQETEKEFFDTGVRAEIYK